MANDLNRHECIGRLGEDPSCKYLPSGEAVTNISVACSSSWKDKQGNKQEATEWIRYTAFGKLAEIMAEYLKKGSKVYLSGKMKTRKYQAQDGSDRFSTEIIAESMQMLDGKPESVQPQQARQAPAQTPYQQAQAGQQAPAGFDDPAAFDDIPF